MYYPYANYSAGVVTNVYQGMLSPIGVMCHFTDMLAFPANMGVLGVHFRVDRNGTVYQFVDTNDFVWHAHEASRYYIGIEHDAKPPFSDLTVNQLQGSAALCAWLSLLYGIPVQRSFGDQFTPGFKSHLDGAYPRASWNSDPRGAHIDSIWQPDYRPELLNPAERAKLIRTPWTWFQYAWAINFYRSWWLQQGVTENQASNAWLGQYSGGEYGSWY
jgi:N-acetylmuramoyl-L-alanine amidase